MQIINNNKLNVPFEDLIRVSISFDLINLPSDEYNDLGEELICKIKPMKEKNKITDLKIRIKDDPKLPLMNYAILINGACALRESIGEIKIGIADYISNQLEKVIISNFEILQELKSCIFEPDQMDSSDKETHQDDTTSSDQTESNFKNKNFEDVGSMFKGVLEGFGNAFKNDTFKDLHKKNAQLIRVYYEELIIVGFNESEALQIVCSQGNSNTKK